MISLPLFTAIDETFLFTVGQLPPVPRKMIRNWVMYKTDTPYGAKSVLVITIVSKKKKMREKNFPSLYEALHLDVEQIELGCCFFNDR
jgi:hypothetical protein